MSPTPRWFVAFERALRDRGLPLTELACHAGQLRIVLDGTLTAIVRPRSSNSPGWSTTRQFILAYDGTTALTATQEAWMQHLAEVVERLERHIPPGLSQSISQRVEDGDPRVRFRQRYAFCTVEESARDDVALTEILVRTTDRCNQRCPFCSGPPTGHPDDETLRQCLADAATAYAGAMLTLTGGEPTLRRRFVDEVSLALGLPGVARVHVQTNAVSFADRIPATSWPASDRLAFFVSLHALDEALYDRCTGTHGQLGPALAGTRALIDAGHRVFINTVVSRLNIDSLSDYLRALRRALPWPDTVILHFSILTCPEFRPEAAEVLVPYTELAAALSQAYDQAVALGLRVQPLRSSTHASLPACVLALRHREEAPRRARPRPDETGYEDLTRPWVKAARCRACRETATCLGVPRAYAARIGLNELTPLEDPG